MNKTDHDKKLVEKINILDFLKKMGITCLCFLGLLFLIGVIGAGCESNAKQKAEQQAQQEALAKAEFAKTPEGIAQAKAEKARKEKEAKEERAIKEKVDLEIMQLNIHAQARTIAQQMAKDPSSVKFRNDYAKTKNGHTVICGEINAKNGFGGYGGFQRFMSNGNPDGTFYEENTKDFNQAWKKYCL